MVAIRIVENRPMAALIAIAHQIASERDPYRLLNKVCAATREVTGAEHAIIAMVTRDASAFRRVVTSGIDEETVKQMEHPRLDSPALKQVFAERRAVRMRNPGGRPETIGLPASHPPTYSSLVVPIASPTRIYGCLGLRNKLGADGFSDRDEEVALALATQAGVAYENARLIEDLRRHATELYKSDERTQYALGEARMGVWELDLTSDGVTWSETLAPLFGLTPEQAPTTREAFFALIHPDDRQKVVDSVVQNVREGTEHEAEFRVIWPDGSEHWVAGRGRVVRDASGKPERLLGVGMDIGDRKTLESQFQQAQKMEAIGQLAGGVAHDFNNLLTAIHGYADLVLSTLGTGDVRRDYVDEIIRAAGRATALTRQLLAFSRKQVLQPKLLDLNCLVTDALKMLRRLIGEDIELTTTLTPEPGPVYADAGQIEQILMNLVVNARDAMPNGGRLSIRTANVTIDDPRARPRAMVRSGAYVLMTVTDNGQGMDEQTKRRIFEPFFTTKERGRGTGLGLATVYGIVTQSGGHIRVDSEPGRGAAFKIYLPRAEKGMAVERPVAQSEEAPAGSERILLVEDERAVRQLSRALLEQAGYRVHDAADPEQAQAVFRQHAGAIDLLVTDMVMPGSSGASLFERLSAERRDLKVLYMSGYTDHPVVHRAGSASDVVFLQKPFTAAALKSKVREALDR